MSTYSSITAFSATPGGVNSTYMNDATKDALIASLGTTFVPTNNVVQYLTSSATAGTFTLTFGSSTSTALPFDATITAIQAALDGMAAITDVGGITVTGVSEIGFPTATQLPTVSTSAIQLSFTIPGDYSLITISNSTLTGGSAFILATFTPTPSGGPSPPTNLPTSFLGTPLSTLGSLNLTPGGINVVGPSVFQYPILIVKVNGVPIVTTPYLQLIGATVTYGLDIGVSSATVEITDDPNLSKYDVIQIYADATPKSFPTLRFTGLYLRTEANLWPHSVNLVCRGMLFLAQQYQQTQYLGVNPLLSAARGRAFPPGQALIDIVDTSIDPPQTLPGLIPGTLIATDKDIIVAILNTVSAAYPQFTFNAANIHGTGRLFGLFSKREMVWPAYRSALEQIQLFDAVCLGYRLYESLGGVVHRDIIYGYPSGISDRQFTEGVDIWEGKGNRSVEQLCNSAYVEGAVISSKNNGLIWAFIQSSNPLQSSTAPGTDANTGSPIGTPGWNPITDQFKSPLIETSQAFIDVGINVNGLSANDVAEWRLSERNRELVTTSFVTYLDDPLFPGRTYAVLTPHMSVTEPQWLQRVELRIQSQPALFQQTLYTIGGGLPGADSTAVVQAGSTTTTIILNIIMVPGDLVGFITSFTSGTNLGQQDQIIANTIDTITVSPGFGNTPTPGEVLWLRDYRPPGTFPNFL